MIVSGVSSCQLYLVNGSRQYRRYHPLSDPLLLFVRLEPFVYCIILLLTCSCRLSGLLLRYPPSTPLFCLLVMQIVASHVSSPHFIVLDLACMYYMIPGFACSCQSTWELVPAIYVLFVWKRGIRAISCYLSHFNTTTCHVLIETFKWTSRDQVVSL